MPSSDHDASAIGAILRSAIEQALLASDAKIPTSSELIEISRDANECIKALRRTVASIDTSRLEPRRRTAHTLFLASVSYSEALTFVLAAAPRELSIAGLSLHRPSLESSFRGAFVGFTASDEQAVDFLENGVPRTRVLALVQN